MKLKTFLGATGKGTAVRVVDAWVHSVVIDTMPAGDAYKIAGSCDVHQWSVKDNVLLIEVV